jgi:hypothetical protein
MNVLYINITIKNTKDHYPAKFSDPELHTLLLFVPETKWPVPFCIHAFWEHSTYVNVKRHNCLPAYNGCSGDFLSVLALQSCFKLLPEFFLNPLRK